MEYKYQGTLKFNEYDGKFSIVNEEEERFISNIEFNTAFEVMYNGNWVQTQIEIGNNENGELIFKLKGTEYSGNLDGIQVRMN